LTRAGASVDRSFVREFFSIGISGLVGYQARFFMVCPAGHTYFEVKVLYGPDSGNH
jgi:hypothetical protein